MPLYRRRKSPHWWIRFSIGGIKTRCSSGTTDKAAAEEFEATLRAARWREHRLGDRPRYTWREAVEKWSASAEGRGKARDLERLNWFGQHLNDLALADITPDIIEKLRRVRAVEATKKFGRGDGKSTANRYMAQLRIVLRKARDDWDWVGKIPKIPMFKIGKREPRFMTKHQAAVLLKELAPLPHLRIVAEFDLETGLRMRNVTGLTWDQVDLRRRLVIVPASHAKAGDTITVPLSARAIAILKGQRGRHPQHVFTFLRGPKGKPRPFEDANGRDFKAAAARAGVSWLRWHDLRHTWASWHIQGGTPLHVLQALGGWKSYAMVLRYAHLSTGHLKAFAEHRKGTPRK